MLEPTVGHEVDGIIGSRLFDDFVVAVDCEHRRLSLYAPGKYEPSGNATALPIFVDSHDAHHLPPPTMKLLEEPGTSTGGTTRSRDGRADEISIGPYSVKDPPITFGQDTEGLMAAKDHAGLIGAEFLERFTVVFDNPGKRLFLTPNQHYNDIAGYDGSGLRMHAEGPDFHRFVVMRTTPRSPATEAGINPGDVIESIDDRPANQLTLTEIRNMLRRADARYKIDITRGNSHLRVTLKLQPVI